MIRRVHVTNLRSLENLELALRPLNIFVGPNGSGKSSILGVFGLLQEYGLRGAQVLQELGKHDDLFWRGGADGRATITIDLEGDVTSPTGEKRDFDYHWSVAKHRGAWLGITGERFRIKRPEGWMTLVEAPAQQQGMLQFYGEDGRPTMGMSLGGQSALSMAAQQYDETSLTFFAREVLNWEFISTSPSYARAELPAKRETRLSSGGENLSAVLHSIYNEDHEAFQRIADALHAAIPEIKSIITPITPEGQTYIAVIEENSRFPIPIWALSDGTIALLSIFTLLEGKAKPALIGIEEPENFVHPGVLEYLAESIKRASEECQILLTTHSPSFLNLVDPEDVLVVEKTQGRTAVHPARDTQGVREAAKKLGLGELWVSGGIGGVP